MCHSEAVDYSIGAAGSPSSGPDARHNCIATRYRKLSLPNRLFRRTIPDQRPIRPHDDEHRGVQRSLALSGFVGEHVFGPRVQGPHALLGEIVTLVDGGDTAELRQLVREELIDRNRVETQPRVEAPVRRRSCRRLGTSGAGSPQWSPRQLVKQNPNQRVLRL